MQNAIAEERERFPQSVDLRIPEQIVAEIDAAKASGEKRTFMLYDVTLTVTEASVPCEMYIAFLNAFHGSAPKNIGPEPETSHTDLGTPPPRMAEVAQRLKRRNRIAWCDTAAWETHRTEYVDPCGFAQLVTAYAERLARFLEVRMIDGQSLEEGFDAATFDVDFDGIRRLVLPKAIAALVSHWAFGEELMSIATRHHVLGN